jgi:processive 1,2-diacylglycerol beta-glucosyltransferase
MIKDPKVLILYTTYGDGHVQVMKAVKHQLQQIGVTRIITLDLMAEAHPVLNAVSRFAYFKSMVYFPQLYGWSYDLTNQVGIWQ